MGTKKINKVKDSPELSATKEFSLCRDGGKKRTKEEGIAFFQEQRDQAILDKNDLLVSQLNAILNNLTGGKSNGLRIEPDRVRKKSKH
jgi:hypothetical protein